jgi:hypothetical protein
LEELEALAAHYNLDTTGIDDEEEDEEKMCLCEYRHGDKTRHMMACEDFDAAVHYCVCSDDVFDRAETEKLCVRALQERMRMPWPGGAKEIDCGIPCAYCGLRYCHAVYFTLAQYTLAQYTLTISLLALLSYLQLCALKTEWPTRFFLTWLCLSIYALCSQFQVGLVSECSSFFLLALCSHLLLTLAALALSLYWRADQDVREAAVEGGYTQLRGSYCGLCKCWVYGRDFHCVWLNCCVGAHNHRSFLCFLFLFTILASEFCWMALKFDPSDGRVISLRVAGGYAGLIAAAAWLSLLSQIYKISANILPSENAAINDSNVPPHLVVIQKQHIEPAGGGTAPSAQLVGREAASPPPGDTGLAALTAGQVLSNWRRFWDATRALQRIQPCAHINHHEIK